jgi:hypothetical protein
MGWRLGTRKPDSKEEDGRMRGWLGTLNMDWVKKSRFVPNLRAKQSEARRQGGWIREQGNNRGVRQTPDREELMRNDSEKDGLGIVKGRTTWREQGTECKVRQ